MSISPHPERLRPMLELIEQLPDQLAAARAIHGQQAAPAGVRRIFFCGMGGSSIAASILSGVFEQELGLLVHRGYALPRWLDRSTLLVFGSYSGHTEETLAAYELARTDFAKLPRCALGAGGRLEELAASDGVPYFRLPSGLPPRAALGYGIGVLRYLVEACGLVAEADADIEASIELLRAGNLRLGMLAPANENRSCRLARRLYGRLPMVYGGGGLSSAVAVRWTSQFNENAKVLAHAAVLPELDHNEIMGWGVVGPVREAAFVLALRDPGSDPRILRRFAVTRDVLAAAVRDWEDIEAEGERPFARAMSLVQLGDFLSVYLAGECGVDPMEIGSIDRLKARLAQTD